MGLGQMASFWVYGRALEMPDREGLADTLCSKGTMVLCFPPGPEHDKAMRCDSFTINIRHVLLVVEKNMPVSAPFLIRSHYSS